MVAGCRPDFHRFGRRPQLQGGVNLVGPAHAQIKIGKDIFLEARSVNK